MISITKTHTCSAPLVVVVLLGVFAFTLSAHAALDMRSAPTSYPTSVQTDTWTTQSSGATRTNYPTAVQNDAWAAPSSVKASSGSASTDQLKAMIENLQKRVAALTKLVQERNKQAGLSGLSGAGGSAAATPAEVTRNLGVGSKGVQVTSLQQCLSNLGFFNREDMDPTYGPKTRRAVKAFQEAQGIVSSGNEWTTGYGYVGPKTRKELNAECRSTMVPPTGIPNTPYTSGFSASPTSGEAPLEVKFESNFNMWMVKPSIYYGDGESELVERCYAPNDACSKPGVNTHTYEEAGTYKVVVKDDNEVYHRKTITVTE